MSKIIIASIPRCGSTLLARAMVGLPQGDRWPEDMGGVIKQHFPGPIYRYKAVFLFGDIIKAIISTRLNRWNKQSFLNCGCSKSKKDINIFNRDDLNFEYIFDYWTQIQACSVLVVRYENMWNHKSEIEEFAHRKISFPQERERRTKLNMISNQELDSIYKTYKELILKIEKMPDIKLIER